MTAFVSLLKREWLESRATVFWATFGLLAFLVVATALAGFVAMVSDVSVVTMVEEVDGNQVYREERSTDSVIKFAEFRGITDRELSARITMLRTVLTVPFLGVFMLVLLFILLGCIYDERRDHTVLFWKSMPVTDLATVASKLLTPVWLAPIAVVIATLLAWIFFLMVGSVMTITEDLGSVSRLWLNSGLLVGLLQLILGFVVQGLWSLPIYGWLLLVSATATRLPLAWALALPVGAVLLERILTRSGYIADFILRHLELAAFPRVTEGSLNRIPTVQNTGDQLALLLTGDLWLGVLLGAALVGGAVYFRSRNNEI